MPDSYGSPWRRLAAVGFAGFFGPIRWLSITKALPTPRPSRAKTSIGREVFRIGRVDFGDRSAGLLAHRCRVQPLLYTHLVTTCYIVIFRIRKTNPHPLRRE